MSTAQRATMATGIKSDMIGNYGPSGVVRILASAATSAGRMGENIESTGNRLRDAPPADKVGAS